MRLKKKLVMFLAVLLFIFGIVGCSSEEEPVAPPSESKADSVSQDLVAEDQISASNYGGGFDSPITVELSFEKDGYSIYYTMDGTAPNASSERYTGPIQISASTLLTAIAVNDQDQNETSQFFQGLYLKDALIWLDASDRGKVILSGGNTVARVLDKSGNDYHAEAVGEQVVLAKGALADNPVFRFDRSSGFWLEYSMGAFDEITVYIVHQRLEQFTHDSQYARLLSSVADPEKDVWVSPNFHYMVPVGSNYDNRTPYEARICQARFTGVEAGPIGVGFEARIYDIYEVIGSGAYVGDIGELFMLGRPVSEIERNIISKYLNRKWGFEQLVYEPVAPKVAEVETEELVETVAIITDPKAVEDADIPDLIATLSSDNTEVVWAVRSRLEQMGLEALEPLIALLEDTNKAWPARWSAVRVLGRIADERPQAVIPSLIWALSDDVPNIRSAAASNIGRLGAEAEGAISVLVEVALHDEDDDVRTQAIDALGQIGVVNDQVLGAIGIAVGEDVLTIAMAGNRALRSLGAEREKIAYVLIDFLEEGTVSQARIMMSFRRIGSISISPLVEMLSFADQEMRYQITNILGSLMPASVAALTELVHDDCLSVRREAISFLGGATTAVDEIVLLLSDLVLDESENEFVRFVSMRSILALNAETDLSAEMQSLAQQYAEYQSRELFVSSQGKDAWTGRYSEPTADGQDGPFATLERARDEIRRNKTAFASLPKGGVTVWVRGGKYLRQDTFLLEQVDAGTEHSPVVYRPYANENVVLTGGIALEAEWFKPVKDEAILQRIICEEARTHVLQVDLSEYGITDYGELSWRRRQWATFGDVPPMEVFIDGKRMLIARWPNDGSVQMAEIIDSGPTRGDADFTTRGGTFTYNYSRPHLWIQAEDIWLEGIFGYSWEWSYNRVESIDVQNRQITLAYGEQSGLIKQWYPDHHTFENLLEEIDVPGEYYIDRNTGILYMYPPPGFDENSNIVISMLREPVVTINNASHITFENFQFVYGRNRAINVDGGQNISIRHNEITNFTGGGISIIGNQHKVINNHIHHVGGTGILVEGGNWETLTGGGNLIYNNKIHDIAYWNKVYNPAVLLRGVGHHVVHNKIFNTPHVGIHFFGNDHLIEYNELHHVASDYSDMGAIYTWGANTPWMRGTIIRRNYFHRIGDVPGIKAVYLDDGTSGVTVEENIFQLINTKYSWNAAILHDTGHNNIARYNIFIDSPVPYYQQYHLTHTADMLQSAQRHWEQAFNRYDFETMPHSKYPGFLELLEPKSYYRYDDYGITYPNSSVFLGNLSFNPTVRLSEGKIVHFNDRHLRTGMDSDSLLAIENNFIATTDPGFKDFRNDDFRLKEDAPIFDWIPGFPSIPFEKMGLIEPVGVLDQP